MESGCPAGHSVVVRTLSRERRERLREALSAVRHVDTLTHDLLF
jgi:hypothetical protein